MDPLFSLINYFCSKDWNPSNMKKPLLLLFHPFLLMTFSFSIFLPCLQSIDDKSNDSVISVLNCLKIVYKSLQFPLILSKFLATQLCLRNPLAPQEVHLDSLDQRPGSKQWINDTLESVRLKKTNWNQESDVVTRVSQSHEFIYYIYFYTNFDLSRWSRLQFWL